MLGLVNRPKKAMTHDEVRRKTANQRHLYSLATQWLQFMGILEIRPVPVTPIEKKIRMFVDYMEKEKEFSSTTIETCCWFVRKFFDGLHVKGDSLRRITPHRIDMAFQKMLAPGGYSRNTIQTWAYALRAFFRFAAIRGWCRKGLAESIQSPRVFSQSSLPLGPSWGDVQRLLATTEGDRRHNIRARAILMLLAVYGLRAGEVSHLQLEDFDWEHEVFRGVL